jgi:hypothetical protein
MIKRTSSTLALFLLVILSGIHIIQADSVNEGTTVQQNTTVTTPIVPEKKLPVWTGFIGCLIASIFFGSNLLPVKQFSAGDGFFFQFVFCVAVWAVGLIVDLVIGNDRFYPLVLVGGRTYTNNLSSILRFDCY